MKVKLKHVFEALLGWSSMIIDSLVKCKYVILYFMIRWLEILVLMANVELKTFPKVGNFELKSYPKG